MGKTSIEWTDASINPIRARRVDPDSYSDENKSNTGHYCEKLSSGCANCYASRLQSRFLMPGFPGHGKPTVGEHGDIDVFFDEKRLLQVLKRKTPTKWFWCDMTDMFGHWVPDEWIDKCFAVMALTPWHTHQVLTKRPERMARYLTGNRDGVESVHGSACSAWHIWGLEYQLRQVRWRALRPGRGLRNCKLATQKCLARHELRRSEGGANERIPHLLRCPAAVRFLSCEPLLGPIDLYPFLHNGWFKDQPPGQVGSNLHWAITGGESGPKARPMALGWAKDIVRQCQEAGVPVFVKQCGSNPTNREGERCPHIKESHGRDMAEWPEELRVRQFPAIGVQP